MKATISTRASLILALLTCFGCSASADPPENPKGTAEADKAADAKREAVAAEVKQLGNHPWAGEYYYGDGLGVNISVSIAPQAGYVYEWHGCLGLYDRNYGAVKLANDRIELTFTFDNKNGGSKRISEAYVPVQWGDRHYLIGDDEMIEFCHAVNSGRESRGDRHGYFLLRRGDEEKKVDGFPAVPREFKKHLLEKPVETKVIAVGKPTVSGPKDTQMAAYPVTFDAGSNHGLQVGMELFAVPPQDVPYFSCKITKVEPDRCEGVYNYFTSEKLAPQAGWQFSTRDPMYDESDK
jgi:hypothetical protein